MLRFSPDELARWAGGQWTRLPPADLLGVGTDTRADLRGQLFIALRGQRHDAHDYLAQAVKAGAAAALVEEPRLASLPSDFPLLVVPDTRQALRDLAAGHRGRLDARFIGITGSAGKTTVKELTADLLQAAGPTTRTRGNWNNDIGLPLSLLAMPPGQQFGVFELGTNHPGELAPLCRILRHECGVVTTVGVSHAEFFPDREAIAREKAEVLRAVPADGVVVVGAAEPHRALLCTGVAARVITVALEGDADYRAHRHDGLHFEVRERASGERALFTAPQPGAFFVYDALLAVAVARHYGVAWEPLAAALSAYLPLKLRGQTCVLDGVCFVNDAYNANPLSMGAALQAFAERAVAGRRWLVLGGMGELGDLARAEHLAVGAEITRLGFHGLVVVGALAAWIAEGAVGAGFAGELVKCPHPVAAAAALRARAMAGDAVLLKGSRSERMEEILTHWTGSAALDGGHHG
jgi:UDP-N-acetylmuramoyl-tripeptide--D-alanyl-D-alanine ligase